MDAESKHAEKAGAEPEIWCYPAVSGDLFPCYARANVNAYKPLIYELMQVRRVRLARVGSVFELAPINREEGFEYRVDHDAHR